MRRGRLLLALQAVKRARALEPASPEAHTLLLRFCHAVQEAKQQVGVHARSCHASNPHQNACGWLYMHGRY